MNFEDMEKSREEELQKKAEEEKKRRYDENKRSFRDAKRRSIVPQVRVRNKNMIYFKLFQPLVRLFISVTLSL